jgi:hypothetical protein
MLLTDHIKLSKIIKENSWDGFFRVLSGEVI